MWPFKKKRRFILLKVETGSYYAGPIGDTGRNNVWSFDIHKAMRFSKDESWDMRMTLLHMMIITKVIEVL